MSLRSVILLICLAAFVPAVAHAGISSRETSDSPESAPPKGLKPLELHVGFGAGGLSTPGTSKEFVYRDGGAEYPLTVSTKAGWIAPGGQLSIYVNTPSLSFGRLQLSPYVSGEALVGSLFGARGTAGLRAMVSVGQVRPWLSAGVGYAQLTGEIAQVDPGNEAGADFITAPDGTRVLKGESINAAASAFGADFRAGLNFAFTETWGLSGMVGYSLFASMTKWEAKARNESGDEISLGRLSGIPPARMSGLNAFVGITYSYQQ